jgi:hypothetical protein
METFLLHVGRALRCKMEGQKNCGQRNRNIFMWKNEKQSSEKKPWEMKLTWHHKHLFLHLFLPQI